MHLALRLGLVVLCASPVLAQSGPGLPKLTYQPGELFTAISTIQNATFEYGHAFMHDGYLATPHFTPGGVEFYDLSNPYSPQLVTRIVNGVLDLGEPHVVSQTTAYGGKHVVFLQGPAGPQRVTTTGFGIHDWTDIDNPQRVGRYDVPGVPGGYSTGLFWLFYQAPYVYAPAGSLGLFIVDASNPADPFVAAHLPTTQTGGFNASTCFVIGNRLVLSNVDAGTGHAILDIGDPINPILLSSAHARIPYGGQVNGNRLYTASREGFVSVLDLDDRQISLAGELQLGGTTNYLKVQDHFVHLGNSDKYVKIDASNPANMSVIGSFTLGVSGIDEDYPSPIGNLVALGDDSGFGMHIVPHDTTPDDLGPSVTMVVPEHGSTSQPVTSRVGIVMSDMIEFESIDNSTFIVRPEGGQALAGSYSSQFGTLNFTPAAPLQPDTTYEVVVPAGGLRDWSRNDTPETFISKFSTGQTINVIVVAVQPNAATLVGQQLSFNTSSVAGSGTLEYSWDFGDGTPPTPFSTNSQATHTYTRAGHFSVLVTVTNGSVVGTDSYLQTIHYPVTPVRPTHSSTIAISATSTAQRVFCVNPDNDSVTSVHPTGLLNHREIPVGDNPRTVAFSRDERAWVVCQGDAEVWVINRQTYSVETVISLPEGSAPYGIAMSPDGSSAYVTLTATGRVAKLDQATRRWVGSTPVGPDPKGIAVAADSQRIFVTRFRSSPKPVSVSDDALPKPAGEIYELSANPLRKVRTMYLRFDPGPDTESSGRGVPNYLNSLTVSSDGRRLWIPSKKDNIARGSFRSEEQLTFDSTVRTIASQIDLTTNREDFPSRLDFNDRDMAFAAVYSPLGDYAFQVFQGSNALEVRDAYSGANVAGVEGTGLAPQGLVLSPDGKTLYVHNFMSRNVAIYNVSSVTSSTNFAIHLIGLISTVTNETLSPQELQGKQIFYNAADSRMNQDGYISCASCHLDGGQDGRVWDFTQRGEGLRNTITLEGRAGMGHGNVHWTANFDEIQDFENDIRNGFGGDGFMTNAAFQATSNPLGPPKAGLSAELDALAAYVSSLTDFGRSPFRQASGALSAAGQRGKLVFGQLNCAQCHSGPHFTDGKIHDVGTAQPGSGQAIGGPLQGFDTPTLRGLWKSAPYLHNGSARGLVQVLTKRNSKGLHGATGSLTERQLTDLVQYLLQIDDLEPAPR